MARYYTLTTQNARQNGWTPLSGPHESRAAAEEAGFVAINEAHPHPDIYRDTELKNMIVRPASRLPGRWTSEAIAQHFDEAADRYYEEVAAHLDGVE